METEKGREPKKKGGKRDETVIEKGKGEKTKTEMKRERRRKGEK